MLDLGDRPIGRASTIHHCIDTGEPPFVKSLPYKSSSVGRKFIYDHIAETLMQGVIEEFSTPSPSDLPGC